uniref:Ig-like domain-containing protein n=1 Tax=Chelonoidis abingdonii TaxID=106734 RepID=A0A8C0IUG0_CHEAB
MGRSSTGVNRARSQLGSMGRSSIGVNGARSQLGLIGRSSIGVTTSAPDIVAQFQGDVTLSCLFPSQPGMNLQRLTLTWQKERVGAEALVAHSYYYGKEQLERQDQIYRNRTQMDPEGLARGNASLTLRGVRIQDEGIYLCHITSEQGKISVRRQVAVMGNVSSQVTLTCRAEGGYPEASVLWLDGARNNMTVESDTSLQRDPSGLCDVSSRILLPRTGCGNYTCLLESPRQPRIVRHLSISCSPGTWDGEGPSACAGSQLSGLLRPADHPACACHVWLFSPSSRGTRPSPPRSMVSWKKSPTY